MSGLRQLILIVSMILSMAAQQYAGSMQKEIAVGAAADSAANKNTITATQAGGYAALVVGVLTALGNKIPGLGNLLGKLGGAETIGRVVDAGGKVIDSGGRDTHAILDVAKLVLDKGNPQALKLLGQLNLHLTDKPPEPTPAGEPPSREDCIAQLIRRIEIDAAARISGATV